MSIDYRLLDRFETSRKRHEAARLALPGRWRADPRPEAQGPMIAHLQGALATVDALATRVGARESLDSRQRPPS